jgi:CheY-like chemotaxis protein
MSANLLNILHVEDDPNDVLLLQRAFRKTNQAVNIQAVTDGDQAVAYLSGTGPYADREKFPMPFLVLLDLKMPRKSGLEVLSWIRSKPETRRTIVVIFTSSKHDEDVNGAYELGANSYLVKPVGFDALLEMVKGLMQYWGTLNQRPVS